MAVFFLIGIVSYLGTIPPYRQTYSFLGEITPIVRKGEEGYA